MTAKRQTREQLLTALGELHTKATADMESLRATLATARMERDEAIKAIQDLRKKLDDTKERLAFAESENQRMRGYVERVQEDDVVREELVTTGSPHGEQRLVPKRKPTIFAPQVYASVGGRVGYAESKNYADGGINDFLRGTDKPRHWVTY